MKNSQAFFILLYQVRTNRQLPPPPDQRPNWPRLNEGQRRYAWEQYNRALVNRGLPIDHPIPEREPDSPDPEPSVGELPELVDLDSELGSPMSGHHRSIASASSSSDSVQAEAGPSKRARVEGQEESPVEDVDMPDSTLPGTGADQGASGSSGVGGGTGGVVPYSVPRPLTSKSCVTRTFKKSWKFLSFGYANNIISKAVAGPPASTNYYLTSALLAIPVEFPCFYLSPQEFTILKPGEHVVEVKCKIIQRNVRVAFPTAATASSLATLNQNKNTQIAVGLNLTGYGLDLGLTAAAEFPMVPTNVVLLTDAEISTFMAGQFYGANNNDATDFAVALPTNATGAFNISPRYWCTATNSLATGGWPSVKNHFREIDSADAVGKTLVDYTYKPAVAPLKPSAAYRDVGAPYKNSNVALPHSRGVNTAGELLTVATAATTPSLTPSAATLISKDNTTTYYNTRIEKSQSHSKGYVGSRGYKVQPSVHVGVQAVPALTTDEVTSNFVDVQAYFDIACEMTTSYCEDTDRQHPSAANTYTLDVPLNDQFTLTNLSVPNFNRSTFLGMYPSGAINLGT